MRAASLPASTTSPAARSVSRSVPSPSRRPTSSPRRTLSRPSARRRASRWARGWTSRWRTSARPANLDLVPAETARHLRLGPAGPDGGRQGRGPEDRAADEIGSAARAGVRRGLRCPAVAQRPEEGHHVVDLGIGQDRRVARLAPGSNGGSLLRLRGTRWAGHRTCGRCRRACAGTSARDWYPAGHRTRRPSSKNGSTPLWKKTSRAATLLRVGVRNRPQ